MQTLIKFKNFVDEINLENGRNYKISVLKKYKDDSDIKYYLNFICNKFIVTGISEKKLSKEVVGPAVEIRVPDNVIDMLQYIRKHNTGRDIDLLMLNHFEYFYLNNDSYLVELFEKIVTKNISLGIESKTINSVIDNLIPEFSVQLANRYFDKPEIVEGKEFALTTKIDGSRIIAMKDKGKVFFFTRQGQEYVGLVDLQKELEGILEDNFVLDGELVASNSSKQNTYKNTMKLSRTKDSEKHGLKMLVFDYIPVEDFKNQFSNQTYIQRRVFLNNLFKINEFNYFELLPILYQGNDSSKILEILNVQTEKGEEGIMINMCNDVYAFRRSNSILKCKLFQDTEVKIIGFENGTNRLSNTLGALICQYKNNICRVGSGFSDDIRDEIWNNKEKWLNKIITVKYFEESYDSKTNLPSLRFPVFLRVRED